MKLGNELRKYLAEQARTAGERMRASSNEEPEIALYYYSAVFGALQRVMNLSYNSQLCLLHHVFLYSHREVATRLELLRQGKDKPITLSPEVLSNLAEAVLELSEKIGRSDDDFAPVLEKVASATFATTGNGYYLLQTDKLSLG